ncbi:Rpp14/Pop5 family protein [Candidatus Aenigmatarchaeota archaeon]
MAEESRPKILPQSLRGKKRYVVFEILSDEKIEYSDFSSAVWNTLLGFLGDLKSSEAKVFLIKNLYVAETKRGVIKVDHNYIEELRAVLSLIQYIGETKIIVKILGVTGTIKSAQTKYLEVLKKYE